MQKNCDTKASSKPAASGTGGPGAKTNEGKRISGPSLSGEKVGPKDAPYLQK